MSIILQAAIPTSTISLFLLSCENIYNSFLVFQQQVWMHGDAEDAACGIFAHGVKASGTLVTFDSYFLEAAQIVETVEFDEVAQTANIGKVPGHVVGFLGY
jgi:hypothetical protein